MDNTTINQTQMEQMPNGMNSMPPTGEHKRGKGLFIAILIIVVALLLGYWYMSSPQKVPTVPSDTTSQQSGTQNNPDTKAAVTSAISSENDLNSMYFDGVSSSI